MKEYPWQHGYESWDLPIKDFKAGANWQKGQMMKNTVNAIVHETSHSKYFIQDTDALTNALANYNDGDKVKIIIVKKEKQ